MAFDPYGRPIAGTPGGYPSPAPPPMPATYQSQQSYPGPASPPPASQQYPQYGGQPLPSPPPQQQQQQQQQQPPSSPGPAQQVASPQQQAPQQQEQTGFFGRIFKRGDGQQQQQPTDGQQQEQEQQGFLGRIFKRAKSLGPGDGDQQQVPVADAPRSARCIPSKPLPEDQLAQLHGKPLSPSRFNFLNKPPGQLAESAAIAMAAGGKPPPVTMTALAGPPPEVTSFGPFLRFNGYDPVTRAYRASVLMVVHQTRSPQPPQLKFRDVDVPRSETPVPAQHLDHYQGWNFWRFDMTVECAGPQRTIEYMVIHSTDHAFTYHQRYRFYVPGAGQKWHWGFYSCNGFHDPQDEARMGGIQNLWRDVLHCHSTRPLHVLVGGGDQLYNDPVWQLPALVQWCQIRDANTRHNYPFTQDMVNQVFDFFFRAYIRHWSQPLFGDALATIPQAMTWDDHDIFDGWGSYPAELQNSQVFQGVFFIAKKFYALFQQHSTPERIYADNLVFGEFGWNWVTTLGASTALVVLDTRSERTREAIVRPMSWQLVQAKVAALPPSVRHVVVVAGVPVVYPKVPVVESALKFLSEGRSRYGINLMLQKSGLADSLYNQFGLVDLVDDLLDHWSADVHADEKRMLVAMMQDLSLARGFRFTLISGDVHVAAVGRLCTQPKVNLRHDHRYVPQIISSAIGNVPPPSGVVKALTASAVPKQLDAGTVERMMAIFGTNQILKASRNWCLVDERQLIPGAPGHDGCLVFQLRVENAKFPQSQPEVYEVIVPVLDLPGGTSYAPRPVARPQPMQLPSAAPVANNGAAPLSRVPGYSAAQQMVAYQQRQLPQAPHLQQQQQSLPRIAPQQPQQPLPPQQQQHQQPAPLVGAAQQPMAQPQPAPGGPYPQALQQQPLPVPGAQQQQQLPPMVGAQIGAGSPPPPASPPPQSVPTGQLRPPQQGPGGAAPGSAQWLLQQSATPSGFPPERPQQQQQAPDAYQQQAPTAHQQQPQAPMPYQQPQAQYPAAHQQQQPTFSPAPPPNPYNQPQFQQQQQQQQQYPQNYMQPVLQPGPAQPPAYSPPAGAPQPPMPPMNAYATVTQQQPYYPQQR